MKPNTTSLEWSKELAEAGIVMETEFFWCEYTFFNEYGELETEWRLKNKQQQKDEVGLCFQSPTVTELMEKMPMTIKDKSGLAWCLRIFRGDTGYFAEYHGHCSSGFHPTPQDALAQLFIYIKKNGLV